MHTPTKLENAAIAIGTSNYASLGNADNEARNSQTAQMQNQLNRCAKVCGAFGVLSGLGVCATIVALTLLDIDNRSRDEVGVAAATLVGVTVLLSGISGWMFCIARSGPTDK